jgi:hypothetical protein
MPGPGRKRVLRDKSLGAGFPCASSGQCDVAVGGLGGDEARSTLSKISKGKRFVFEKKLIWTDCKQDHCQEFSTDNNVFIYSGSVIRRVARGLLLSLIALLLILPVVICTVVQTKSIRIVVVVLSTIVYLLLLSTLTKCKTMNLIVATAT